MHDVGFDVVQEPLIVRDDDGRCLRRLQLVHSVGNDAEGVDVQSAIRLVEDRELRLEHRHLEYLVPLLLPARKTFVHAAAGEFVVQLDDGPLLAHQLQEVRGGYRRQPLVFPVFVHRSAHEVHHAHARNFDRVLETQEQALAAPVFGRHREEVFSVEHDLAFRNGEGGITHEHAAERTLARTVRAHDGMNLAVADSKVDALQYLFAIDAGV